MLRGFLVLSCVSSGAFGQAPDDFAFVQISDTHVEVRLAGAPPVDHLRGEETFRWMANALKEPQTIGEISAPPPSFVVATGDLTEFGAVGDTWKDVERLFAYLPCPWWPVPGNHDQTWHPIDAPYLDLLARREREWRAPRSSETSPPNAAASPSTVVAAERGTKLNRHELSYSFDAHGCHFLVLNSATRQEPLPSFDAETLAWVKNDVVVSGPRVPVFVFLHHPPDSTEFAQPVTQRLLFDALDGANVVLMLYGHGHAVKHHQVFGVDCVQGGSTFAAKGADARGCNVVSVKDGVLRVAYRYLDDAKPMQLLLEKPVASVAPIGVLELDGRWEMGSVRPVRSCMADDPRVAVPGFVDVRLELRLRWGSIEPDTAPKLWLDDEPVDDRFVECLGSTDGPCPTRAWRLRLPEARVETGAHVVFAEWDAVGAPPRVAARALNFWRGPVSEGDPPPTGHAPQRGSLELQDVVYLGHESGLMLSIPRDASRRGWTYSTGGWAIESAPALAGDLLVFGAWDGNVHAVNKDTGELAWKVPGPTSSRSGGAARYYAPADVSPVVIGERIFVCDRGYSLAWYSFTGERHDLPFENVAAIAGSEDGRHLYLRGKDDRLTCVDGDGAVVWRTNVDLGRNPAAPVARDGFVHVCSDRGLVSWVRATDGMVLTQWQATPGSYVFAALRVDDSGDVRVFDSSGRTPCLRRVPADVPEPK